MTRSRPRTGARNSSSSSVSRDADGRPAKKQRIEATKIESREDILCSSSSDDDGGGETRLDNDSPKPEDLNVSDRDPSLYENESPSTCHQTAFESALPPVPDDRQAIQQYEFIKASQDSQTEVQKTSHETLTRINNRSWIPGKSSIYVDAFNLALDTVLQDEIHLFNEKEKCVFEQWRSLTYEAQYLSVARLYFISIY